jgi:hypothetical protein
MLLSAPRAHRVALIRRLDFDHLGAHVAEQLPAEGASEQRAEFEHAQIRQGAVLKFDGSGHLTPLAKLYTKSLALQAHRRAFWTSIAQFHGIK